MTGANRGIGLALVKRLLSESKFWRIFATARDVSSAKDLSSLDSSRVVVLPLDVTCDSSCSSLADSLFAMDAKISILWHNAGVSCREHGIEETSSQGCVSLFDVNSTGPLRVTQALMRKDVLRLESLSSNDMNQDTVAKEMTIVVSISSRMASVSDNAGPVGEYYAYRMSKAALNMFCVTLAREFEINKFNAISVVLSPGWVKTRMTSGKGNVTPEECASALVGIVNALTIKDNAKFYKHNGEEIGW